MVCTQSNIFNAMLCYKYMACVTSDMIHTSGHVTLDMRTSTLEPGPLIGLRR